MNKGTIIYVTPTGDFRQKTVKVTSEHSNFLLNTTDDQSHPLEEWPTFPITKPVPVATLEELMEPDPEPGKPIKKWMAICEDNAIWPYTCKMIVSIEQFMRRQRKRLDYREDGIQYARARVVKKDLNQGPIMFAAIVAVIAFSAFALLIALVLANYKFNQPEAPPATALALIALGAVLVREQTRSGRRPLRLPKGENIRCFIFDCTTGEKRHKICPAGLITDNFRNINIYRFDLTMHRAVYTGIVAACVTSLAFAVLYKLAPGFIVVGVPVAMLASSGLAWLSGPLALPQIFPLLTTFTCFYIWQAEYFDEETETFSYGPKQLIPIRHTYGRGIDPAIYDQFKDAIITEQKKLLEARGIEGDVEYSATVNRADSLTKDIEGKIERAKHQIPQEISPKLAYGALFTLAFASMGIFFFVVFATSGG